MCYIMSIHANRANFTISSNNCMKITHIVVLLMFFTVYVRFNKDNEIYFMLI